LGPGEELGSVDELGPFDELGSVDELGLIEELGYVEDLSFVVTPKSSGVVVFSETLNYSLGIFFKDISSSTATMQ
jgi:hypothetical protein